MILESILLPWSGLVKIWWAL